MANVFFAAALLSGILAVSGCVGPLPNIGGLLGGGGGGYPSYGGTQSYPYDPGAGGGYAQPVQPYYQPQPYAYSGTPEVYGYQPAQPVPQVTEGYATSPPGRWIDRRQHNQQDRIRQGRASGQLTPQEARRLQMEQGRIRGAEGRMRADGNLSPQERTRLNGMQNRASQDIYRQRHNGVQPGPTVQSRPTRPAPHTAQMLPGGPPQAPAQPRAAAQPRSNSGRPARPDAN